MDDARHSLQDEMARAIAASQLSPHVREILSLRFARSLEDLFRPLAGLYGSHPDYGRFCRQLIAALVAAQEERPAVLQTLDLRRDLEPDWFLREKMVGYVFYIDRFNGSLGGVLDRLNYLEELGVTYVHFMPCLKPRPGDSDGGYSVMDYRAINPALGNMDDLAAVTAALRERGMSVCIDLVLNHTAKEHAWAAKARAGDPAYRDYYWIFDDAALPEAYARFAASDDQNYANICPALALPQLPADSDARVKSDLLVQGGSQ
jgi:amylosucrase